MARAVCVKMKSVWFVLFALAVIVNAQEIRNINEPGNPIRSIEVSRVPVATIPNFERVNRLKAVICPTHIRANGRVDFPRDNAFLARFEAMRHEEDEEGHLVASQFSGPPTWYNLSPQTKELNRNVHVRHLIENWFSAEHFVRKFLELDGDRQVNWDVEMIYADENSLRPQRFKLHVDFVVPSGQPENTDYRDSIIDISNNPNGPQLSVGPGPKDPTTRVKAPKNPGRCAEERYNN